VCPFCKIAAGEDDELEIVGEDDAWIAFFPKAPATPGHTLVVPRRHVPHYWTLDEQLACSLATACIAVGRAIREALEPAGMNLITSQGAAAEQTVLHLHLHLLPRWEDDRVDTIWPPKRTADLTALSNLAGKVRMALGAV
jgi:histidine triad (HIT) family protein